MLRLRGFIEGYTIAADLMTQQYCQIKWATILPRVLLSTRFSNQILEVFI